MSSSAQQLNLTSLPAQLPCLLEAARQQQQSYEAFLETVLQAELSAARTGRRRVSTGGTVSFPMRLEHFDFYFQPSVSERLMRKLASLNFLQSATNVFLLGPPGVGKTHLACSLATAALEAGHSDLCCLVQEKYELNYQSAASYYNLFLRSCSS